MKACFQCKRTFLKRPKLSWKQFESMKFCGRKCQAKGFVGYKHTEETKEKLVASHLGKPQPWKEGVKSHFWKGGRTKEVTLLRSSWRYKDWRRKIFERDDFTCQWCNQRGSKINADHIKSFARFPELRFELSNGRTLCEPCHRTTDTFAGKSRV